MIETSNSGNNNNNNNNNNNTIISYLRNNSSTIEHTAGGRDERQDTTDMMKGHYSPTMASTPSTSNSTGAATAAAVAPPVAIRFRCVPAGRQLGERESTSTIRNGNNNELSSTSNNFTTTTNNNLVAENDIIINNINSNNQQQQSSMIRWNNQSPSTSTMVQPQQQQHVQLLTPTGIAQPPRAINSLGPRVQHIVSTNQPSSYQHQPSVTTSSSMVAAPRQSLIVSSHPQQQHRLSHPRMMPPQSNVHYVVLNSGNTSGPNLIMNRLSHPPLQQQPTSVPVAVPSSEQTSMVGKCARFFKTLIHLSQQPEQQQSANSTAAAGQHTSTRVLELVRAVIYGTMPPETFTFQLQEALRSQAQPHLLPFLQRTLPALRNALANGELVIDGISAVSIATTARHDNVTSTFSRPQSTTDVGQQLQTQPSAQYPQVVQQLQRNASDALSASSSSTSTTMASQMTNYSQSPSPIAPSPQTNSTPISRQPSSVGAHSPIIPSNKSKSEPMDDDSIDLAGGIIAGVNLAEESSKIVGQCEQLETRTLGANYTEPTLLSSSLLCERITALMPDFDERVVDLISRAAEYRLRELLERLAVVAEHRLDSLRTNPFYVQSSDSRRQLRYLEELDRVEQQRKEDREKEALIRLSRGKGKTNEKDTIREKAKELQRAEQEATRNRDANAAAAAALGTRATKRSWTDANPTTIDLYNPLDQPLATIGLNTQVYRPRTKRVNLRDLQLVLSQDKDTRQSILRYRLAVIKSSSTDPTVTSSSL